MARRVPVSGVPLIQPPSCREKLVPRRAISLIGAAFPVWILMNLDDYVLIKFRNLLLKCRKYKNK